MVPETAAQGCPAPAGSDQQARLKPGGRLIYLMGASGSGKDSLLSRLAASLDADEPILIAHRYITRPASAHEASVALSCDEFERRIKLGCFALHWRSHGLAYGIGVEIDAWMAAGKTVLVNGSRQHLVHACERYPRLLAVEVVVSPAVLKARLLKRGREDAAAIDRRLARAVEGFVAPPRCTVAQISNDAALDTAAASLLTLTRAA